MRAEVHRGYRIALVDSDALQRICTNNSLWALGADSTPFGRVSELVAAIRAGQRFDAVIVGLHADATRTAARWPEVEEAAGRPLPVAYMAHYTELDSVQCLPSRMLDAASFRLLASPVDEDALRTWLNTLDPWDAGAGFLPPTPPGLRRPPARPRRRV
jgi:DNA-binding NtrC family response regulator